MEAPPLATSRVRVLRVSGLNRQSGEEADVVAVEEPLEIRIEGRPVAVTMRTPGHDEELALGFCLSEGLRPAEARLPDDLASNTVEVDAPGFDPERLARSFYTSSSCGVCGKGALAAVAVEAPRIESELRVPAALVLTLPELLREAQAAFEATGGLHATGLFSATGELLCLREDVGRHNALDKVVGWAFRSELLPLRGLDPLRQRPALVRARPEGGGGRLPAARRRRRSLVAGDRARRRPGRDAVRLRPRTARSTSIPRLERVVL